MKLNFPINPIIDKLKDVYGVAAIVLGGSWATKTARSDSDIDIAVYYKADRPLDIKALKKVANLLNDTPNPVITEIGAWGKWVNGGAWLTIRNQRVDFLYRNLTFVENIINDCINGIKQSDFYQQPPYGFHSYIYCAEISVCQVYFDPQNIIAALKKKVEKYPVTLRRSIINGFMWDAQFTLQNIIKPAERGEVYIVSGCLSKIANDLVQVLYALNNTYFLGDKHLYSDITKFDYVPEQFLYRLKVMLGEQGIIPEIMIQTVKIAEKLIADFVKLCGNEYIPKY